MTDDLVERVARAMFVVESDDPDDPGVWEYAAENYRALARAAIEAMREPTEAMIDAGAIYADCNGAHGAWQAMIDAALKEDA